MIAARWIAGGVLLALGTYLGALNWSVFVNGFLRRRPAASWIPLLAGALGALGLVALPVAAARRWWWLPFLLDWGSLPGLGHTLVAHLLAVRRTSS